MRLRQYFAFCKADLLVLQILLVKQLLWATLLCHLWYNSAYLSSCFSAGNGRPILMGHASARLAFRRSLLFNAFRNFWLNLPLRPLYKGGGRCSEVGRSYP
jgi:hypothetical protein